MVAGVFDEVLRNQPLSWAIGLAGALVLFMLVAIYGNWPSNKERDEYLLVITATGFAVMGVIIGMVFFS